MRLGSWLAVGVLACAWSGCGGSDDNEPSGGSFSDIADAVANPTGTLATGNTVAVGKEYGKIMGGSAAGYRLQQQTGSQTQTVSCPAGGAYTVSATGNQSSAHAVLDYDGCCYSAGCCVEGGGDWYFSTQQGASFSYCGTYDLDYTCGGSTAALEYSGCFGADGAWTYVVEVNGETFSATGTYANGNGTLKIKAKNGEYTCTYTNDTGSCTGAAGNFSF